MVTRRTVARRFRIPLRSAIVVAGALATGLAFDLTSARGLDGAPDTTLATVGTRTITKGEVEERVRGQLVEIDTARYELLKEGVEEIIADILLEQEAKARSVSVKELLKAEVTDKTTPVGTDDVDRFYEENKAQLSGNLDDLRPRITAYLEAQQTAVNRAAFLDTLRAKANVKVRLKPPTVKVSADGPSRGPANAAVTIVEFSDFECPFCKRAAATIDQIMERHKDHVRLVFRHYPLPSHQNARRAAEAATCANRDGKFWAYHDLLFRNQNALGDDDLKKYAREAGLDEAAFAACLSSGTASAVVDKDTADGEAVGVNGTPAFFINGRPLSGAQPYNVFEEAIEEALAQQRSP
jgi:protein-disulfide isomerase